MFMKNLSATEITEDTERNRTRAFLCALCG